MWLVWLIVWLVFLKLVYLVDTNSELTLKRHSTFGFLDAKK